VAIRLNNLGSAYFSIHKKKQAKRYFQEAYDIFRRFLDPDHPSTKTAEKWLRACD